MKLTPTESGSSLWFKISEELTNRLATLREKNDGNWTAEETATIRGQIKEVKQLLEMGKPLPVISDADQ